MKKILLGSILLAAAVFLSVQTIAPNIAHAAPVTTSVNCGEVQAKSFVFFNSWNAYLPCDPAKGSYIESIQDVAKLVFWLIDCALKLASFLAVMYITWGGVKYIKAQGDPSEIKAARTTITQAVIGLFICISATAAVNWITGLF